ncbi:MAG TPA: hemolysin family protein [Stellaceae bacterium]|nr:hemolysin family protein [Stellaceae bacterium]
MAEPSIGTPPDDPGEPERSSAERPFRGLRAWLRQLTRSRNGEEDGDTLEEMIEERQEVAEPIDPQEKMLIGNILKLHELNTADVMVQRVDIVALDVDTEFSEAVRLFVEQGRSRMPVYRETLDDVIGFLHVKDILGPLVGDHPVQLAKLVRKVLVVAPSMPLLDLLLQMRLSRIHMAMVVDEFGGIDGLVTIEDLIEEIVGEIEDEHDDAATPQLVQRPDGSVIADARTPIEEFEERFAVRLLDADAEEDIDTLGGLVFMLAGRVPSRGETIGHPDGISFEVLDADPRRVKRLRVRGLPRAVPAPAAAVPGTVPHPQAAAKAEIKRGDDD